MRKTDKRIERLNFGFGGYETNIFKNEKIQKYWFLNNCHFKKFIGEEQKQFELNDKKIQNKRWMKFGH